MKAKFETNPGTFHALLKVHEFELKTREIMSEAWDLADIEGKSWDETNTQRALARAFIAAHSLSSSAASWHRLAEALNGWKLDDDLTQKVLTRMTRRGYLRSRRISDTTHYEVNF